MKKILKKVKKEFKHEIEFAKKIGYEGILIRLSGDSECIYLDSIYNMHTVEDIIVENGWGEDCLMINFSEKSQRVIYMKEAVAA
ncbi:MAG TPA: hypothetical protein EYH01_06755 [Campylobacterales bacterium]|nr:hypothetical protein [Campylobacterales bacterium]